jgi:hypothetical protein
MSDSQDQAEQLDDDVIGTDSPTSDEAPVNFDDDIAYSLDEPRFDEPIVDSYDERTHRMQRDTSNAGAEYGSEAELGYDDTGLIGDISDRSPEESALHVVDDETI